MKYIMWPITLRIGTFQRDSQSFPERGKLLTPNRTFALSMAALVAVALSYAEEPAKAPARPAQPPPQAATGATPKPAGVTPKPADITPDKMEGISFEGLTDAQKGLAFSILKENRCDCGCGMTFAECRVKDSKCRRSLAVATQVISLVKEGKSRDEILKVALSPSWKFVQFPLTAGDAPALGPADAKVTILHYLDYQ